MASCRSITPAFLLAKMLLSGGCAVVSPQRSDLHTPTAHGVADALAKNDAGAIVTGCN